MPIQNYNVINDTTVMVSICDNSAYDEYHHKIICQSLTDAVFESYNLLIRMKSNLSNMRITILHFHIPITIFKLGYNKGLVLYNEDNYIKACSIVPSFAPIDMAFCRMMDSVYDKQNGMDNYPLQVLLTKLVQPMSETMTNTNMLVEKSASSVNPMGEVNPQKIGSNITATKNSGSVHASKTRHTNLLEKAKNVQEGPEKVKIVTPKKDRGFDEKFETKKETERTERIEAKRNNENLKVFTSDKKSYVLIKKDLENGSLKRENMNPYFVLKYQIFKILELRKSVDFTNDDNIVQEYELFTSLYDACDDNAKEDCSLINPKPIEKIYIPPNYQYMTKEKKEEYAKKYKMSLKQFEDKYINCMLDDDIIENHINNPENNTKTPNLSKVVEVDDKADDSDDDSYTSISAL